MTVSRRNKHMYRVTKNENLQQNCMSRHLCLDSFHRIAVHTYSYLNYYLSFDVCVCFRLSCLSAKNNFLMDSHLLLLDLRCLCVFPSVCPVFLQKNNFLMDSHIKKCLYTKLSHF